MRYIEILKMRLQATYLGLRLLIISNYAKLSHSLLDGGRRDEDRGGRDKGGGS